MIVRRRALGQLGVATAGLVVALGVRPASIREILAAYVLALAAIALVALTRLARTEEEWERATSELERALTPHPIARVRPAELVRVERDLVLGGSNAGHFHARLRPLLWSIAAARSRSPHDELDEEAWELLRPDCPAPTDLYGPGVPLLRVRQIVDALERL